MNIFSIDNFHHKTEFYYYFDTLFAYYEYFECWSTKCKYSYLFFFHSGLYRIIDI